MNKSISFPGGAGGNWLLNLIHSLENNIQPATPLINFHKTLKTYNIILNHNYNDDTAKFFNTKSLFNVYLNMMYKFRYTDCQTDLLPIEERFEIMANQTSSNLEYLGKPTDLNWDDIFKNPTKFINDLYSILDQWKIKYVPNDDKIINAIDNYKMTCIDPMPIFNNFENELWLGWCNGIKKHEFSDWKIMYSITEAQDILYADREYFYDYTVDKILIVNE